MSLQAAPYGKWTSPITAEAITKNVVSLVDVVIDPVTTKVYHIEARPSEAGRNTLVDTNNGVELTPGKDWYVRTMVHEYGGAAAIVYNGIAYFSRLSDGRVYRLKIGGEPEAVTPESSVYRFASFGVHPIQDHLLVAILEDHTVDEPSAVVNTLCIINTNTKTVHPLVSGADFYALPKFSPAGTHIAWQQWSHPDMPWEGGKIYIAEVIATSDGISVTNTTYVAGKSQKVSAAFPSWASNETLVFTSDVSGYINPWKYEIQTGVASALLVQPVEIEFGEPQWSLQMLPYAILDGYALFVTVQQGRSGLQIVDLNGGSAPLALESPFVVINFIRVLSSQNNQVVFSGSKIDEAASITKASVTDFVSASVTYTALKPASDPPFAGNIVSAPQPITLKTNAGDPIHAIYYAPCNPAYSGSSIPGELPPCVLNVHGGPTGLTLQNLNWKTQLDVNYGGSSGYGRDYIERLAGKWGLADVDDCIQASRLISLVDPKRVVIRGGSAGGYTTLCALANTPDVTAFAAGTSSYGVSDLKPLAQHTHKFESRYLEKLIGGTPEEIPEVYKERSPVNHAERIVAPLLILQGEIDKVVPKEQADLIYRIVKERGGTVEYKLYPGEGHGWRKEETIKDALERELRFYEGVLGLN
ncbi:hypothetical protein H0H81_000199 [Sphagnurus paluster]|uniref:Peptidase S9 prolyl oligopeptidase catalytic domain-containing protein n=1 Tax=Sphagnurus paluster TaxID=117069 RepID=A0A9P7K342_9AGAR|nr:hypothetical protein H0H81_000199 [Sphagnurus paluster]